MGSRKALWKAGEDLEGENCGDIDGVTKFVGTPTFLIFIIALTYSTAAKLFVANDFVQI